MLELFTEFDALPLQALCSIYEDALLEQGKNAYPRMPSGFALELAEQELKAYLREDFFTQTGAFYALWKSEGQYVSAVRFEPFADGVLLHALHTQVEHRRKGMTYAFLQAVLRTLEGMKIYSHVRKDNPASMALHVKLGFAVLDDVCVYLDGTQDPDAVTFCMDRNSP